MKTVLLCSNTLVGRGGTDPSFNFEGDPETRYFRFDESGYYKGRVTNEVAARIVGKPPHNFRLADGKVWRDCVGASFSTLKQLQDFLEGAENSNPEALVKYLTRLIKTGTIIYKERDQGALMSALVRASQIVQGRAALAGKAPPKGMETPLAPRAHGEKPQPRPMTREELIRSILLAEGNPDDEKQWTEGGSFKLQWFIRRLTDNSITLDEIEAQWPLVTGDAAAEHPPLTRDNFRAWRVSVVEAAAEAEADAEQGEKKPPATGAADDPKTPPDPTAPSDPTAPPENKNTPPPASALAPPPLPGNLAAKIREELEKSGDADDEEQWTAGGGFSVRWMERKLKNRDINGKHIEAAWPGLTRDKFREWRAANPGGE